MRKLKLLSLGCLAFFAFSCSSDAIEAEESSKSITNELERGSVLNYEHVVIEWAPMTSNRAKTETRGLYTRMYGLKSWRPCINDPSGSTEIWELQKCNSCIPQVADPADDDDVERSEVGESCRSL